MQKQNSPKKKTVILDSLVWITLIKHLLASALLVHYALGKSFKKNNYDEFDY
jgi:hypothetical protein